MEIQSINKCIDKATISDPDLVVVSVEQEAAKFDASCYDGDACHSSSG
jgi:hypothetical protein